MFSNLSNNIVAALAAIVTAAVFVGASIGPVANSAVALIA